MILFVGSQAGAVQANQTFAQLRDVTGARLDLATRLPSLLLAIHPAGRTWGLDGRLVARFGDRRPF